MTEIEPCPRYGAGLLNDFGGGDVNWWQDYLRAELERAHDFYEAAWPAPTAPSGDVERAVMVCPQCEGEGGYPDGLDEAACHTECTRCGSNGWIVDRAAIAAMRPAALSDIAAERQRQINAEGWTPDHDDAHGDKSLALAAACYALLGAGYRHGSPPLDVWPWEGQPKAADPRRNLVKAGALIVAEIERLDRAALRQAGEG